MDSSKKRKRSESGSRPSGATPRGTPRPQGTPRPVLDQDASGAGPSFETPRPKAKAARRLSVASGGSTGKKKGGAADNKTPKTPRTPKTPSGKRDKLWCSDCLDRAGPDCGAHHCVGLQTARRDAATALNAAQDTLRRLDKLEKESLSVAPKLRLLADLRGEGDGGEAEVEVTLATDALSADDRRALCAYLEGLELEPDEVCLSASSAGCEALASRVVKLPDRVDGVTLRPGAVLLLGAPDATPRGRGRGEDDDDEGDEEDEEGDGSEVDDDEGSSYWPGSKPAMRIYYNRPVKPNQARGAKVLGYITRNLKHVGDAKPGGAYHLSGWGMRYDDGMLLSISDVKFVSD